jgi:hypothetical protein
MNPSVPPASVQLWAPSLNVQHFRSGLIAASVDVLDVKDLGEFSPGLPLLLVYADPGLLASQLDCDKAAADICELVTLLPSLGASMVPYRLVNLACVHVPSIVGWCIQQNVSSSPESIFAFSRPGPLQALLGLELLRRHPALETAYLALEQHPYASPLDCRHPDRSFLDRYHTACAWDALLEAREEQVLLDRELRELSLKFGTRESQQLIIHRQSEQLQDLAYRLEEADSLRNSCVENTLVIQAQQGDLEVLSRRLAMLEGLLRQASKASLAIQSRFAQLLL